MVNNMKSKVPHLPPIHIRSRHVSQRLVNVNPSFEHDEINRSTLIHDGSQAVRNSITSEQDRIK